MSDKTCCVMCGRPLKSKKSIALGMGPSCARKATKGELELELESKVGSAERPALPFLEELKTKEAS